MNGEQMICSLIARGVFSIDDDGRIWRHQTRTRAGQETRPSWRGKARHRSRVERLADTHTPYRCREALAGRIPGGSMSNILKHPTQDQQQQLARMRAMRSMMDVPKRRQA